VRMAASQMQSVSIFDDERPMFLCADSLIDALNLSGYQRQVCTGRPNPCRAGQPAADAVSETPCGQ
jgi:hypothetical protein